MGSLVEELKRREAAARAEADRLRARIEELSGELARAEEAGHAAGHRPGGSRAGGCSKRRPQRIPARRKACLQGNRGRHRPLGR